MSRREDQISEARDRMQAELRGAGVPNARARSVADQLANVADRRDRGLPVDPDRMINVKNLRPR